MRYLLDTQLFIWWLNDDIKLSTSVKSLLLNPMNNVAISACSIWEIGIKHKLGKLPVPDRFMEQLQRLPFALIDIDIYHAWKASQFPLHHNDPFDRLLIAQAQLEKRTLLTTDAQLPTYDVTIQLVDKA